MKGIVFTELIDMMEARFSLEVADRVLSNSNLASGGVYTAVGTYPHGELVQLVGNLSRETGLPVPALLEAYGRHLFSRFVALYPQFFDGTTSSLPFLAEIETRIHVEVRKLYPEAELPHFDCHWNGDRELVMVYRSSRHMEDFAGGLIAGCAEHFGETLRIEREELPSDGDAHVRFVVSRP